VLVVISPLVLYVGLKTSCYELSKENQLYIFHQPHPFEIKRKRKKNLWSMEMNLTRKKVENKIKQMKGDIEQERVRDTSPKMLSTSDARCCILLFRANFPLGINCYVWNFLLSSTHHKLLHTNDMNWLFLDSLNSLWWEHCMMCNKISVMRKSIWKRINIW